MLAERFREQFRALPLGTVEDLTGGAPFVVLSPHPDDESLGTGGLIAAACAHGQRVDVVLLTDGSGSHPNSNAYPKERLISLRQQEMEAAGKALGLPPGRLTSLKLPDAHAPMSGPSFDAAVSRIAGIVAAAEARTIFVTWRHDPHCDHEAAAAMAVALRSRTPALTLWSYPIWGWHLDAGTEIDAPTPAGYRLDITPWFDRKQAAITAHRSQMTNLIDDDQDGFHFTSQTLAPFVGPFEYFIEVPR